MEIKRNVAIALIVLLAVVVPLGGYVTASYVLTSNHITGDSKAKADLTITSNNTDVTIGDTLKVIAHLTDAKAGVPIQFLNGTTLLNPVVNTDVSGNAIVYYTVDEHYDIYATTNHP